MPATDMDALGIPPQVQKQIGPSAPTAARLATARGLLPLAPEIQIAVLFSLAGDEDPGVASAARQSLAALPTRQILGAISFQTHSKVLEALIEFREPDPDLDARIGMMRTANDRTVRRIVQRANAELCELLSRNHERLLVTPEVFIDLHANPQCSEVLLASAEAFLRMQQAMPAVPEDRPFRTESAGPKASAAPSSIADLEAEIEAALAGKPSPALSKVQTGRLEMFDLNLGSDDGIGDFSFDLADADDVFSWELTAEREDRGDEDDEVRQTIEVKIREFTVGQKIKLAYKGNKEVRNCLVRDRNKLVAAAVIRSGRCSDGEVASFAGNRNLDKEVIRELAQNNEYLRKYPVRVALVNNPKTPIPVAMSIIKGLNKKDLQMLTRNHNVSGVICQAATRFFKEKHRH